MSAELSLKPTCSCDKKCYWGKHPEDSEKLRGAKVEVIGYVKELETSGQLDEDRLDYLRKRLEQIGSLLNKVSRKDELLRKIGELQRPQDHTRSLTESEEGRKYLKLSKLEECIERIEDSILRANKFLLEKSCGEPDLTWLKSSNPSGSQHFTIKADLTTLYAAKSAGRWLPPGATPGSPDEDKVEAKFSGAADRTDPILGQIIPVEEVILIGEQEQARSVYLMMKHALSNGSVDFQSKTVVIKDPFTNQALSEEEKKKLFNFFGLTAQEMFQIFKSAKEMNERRFELMSAEMEQKDGDMDDRGGNFASIDQSRDFLAETREDMFRDKVRNKNSMGRSEFLLTTFTARVQGVDKDV